MQKRARPLVSVLITAHNRPDELRKTLAILHEQTYPRIELLVVDDASAESLELVVRGAWPGVRFWRNAKNVGLIGSRTFGMAQARGEYILTLDDDSSPVDRDFIERAVARLASEPRLGVLSCRVHEGLEPPGELAAEEERYIHSYIGCGNVKRTSAVRSVGGYRDYFVYYGEESEYALRLIAKGWRILYFPSGVVHHRMSAVGRANARITAYNFRNTVWTVLLDVPFPRAIVELSWKLIVNGIELAKQGSIRWAAWALGSCVRGVPRMLRERRPVSAAAMRTYDTLRFRRVTSAEMLETSRAPSFVDRLRWFWNVWRHRRRARAFWDHAPGGVGRVAWAAPSERPSKVETR